MKAILKYDLPDDRELYEDAQKGTTYKMALYDIQTLLRNHEKYNQNLTDAEREVIATIRQDVHKIIYDCGVKE